MPARFNYGLVNSYQVARFAGRRNRVRKEIPETKKEKFWGVAGHDDKFVKLSRKEDEEARMAREVTFNFRFFGKQCQIFPGLGLGLACQIFFGCVVALGIFLSFANKPKFLNSS